MPISVLTPWPIRLAFDLRKENPLPETLPMLPEQMPGFRGPRISKGEPTAEFPEPEVDVTAYALMSTIVFDDSNGHDCLSHVAISFGTFASTPSRKTAPLYNSNLPETALQILKMPWAVYGFNSGHFISTIQANPSGLRSF